jgi:hypothetical protein
MNKIITKAAGAINANEMMDSFIVLLKILYPCRTNAVFSLGNIKPITKAIHNTLMESVFVVSMLMVSQAGKI